MDAAEDITQLGTSRRNKGIQYSESDIDYFWSQVRSKKHLFTTREQSWIDDRRPSIELANSTVRLADQKSCFTLTGRLRARATYCARHNTVFQGLAADGAKLALWKVWRAGFRIVNFIHDELLVEVPVHSCLGDQAEHIKQLMIAGMKEVVPDVAVDVEYAASNAWYKSAKQAYDQSGNLTVWTPDKVGQELNDATLCSTT